MCPAHHPVGYQRRQQRFHPGKKGDDERRGQQLDDGAGSGKPAP